MFGFPMRVTMEDGRMIIMRPLKEEEMTDVATHISSYEVCRYLEMRGAQNAEQELEWLKARFAETDSFGWGVCVAEHDKDTVGRPVGMSGVNGIKNNRGESGVVLWDRSIWGNGIASAIHRARCLYAVDCHHLVAIDSGFFLPNVGSGKALHKVGYAKVGITYNHRFVDGQPCHAQELLWVNPTEHSWNYFWGDNEIPRKFHKARERAFAALERARTEITFL